VGSRGILGASLCQLFPALIVVWNYFYYGSNPKNQPIPNNNLKKIIKNKSLLKDFLILASLKENFTLNG
jgi:hypothetical protein